LVDAGSITAAMLLARRNQSLPTYALTFEDTDPVVSRWQVRFDADGRLTAATDLGGLTAGFEADGRPIFSARIQGNGLIESRVLEATAFGGAGVPLSAERVWAGTGAETGAEGG
jgi:YD repeat-containing protein